MATRPVVRDRTHAGSWYTTNKAELERQLTSWLDNVQTPVTCIGPQSKGLQIQNLPVPGARVIIAPHAGYAYSGPAAAWAYKAWDLSQAKRVFLLGPSHHYYTSKACLSKCSHYATPLGNLVVDQEITGDLYKTGNFEYMSQDIDEDEHSLEMHLPYIYKRTTEQFGTDTQNHPQLIPIMIGNTSSQFEGTLAETLAPYLSDPTTAWVISSDFAHWGERFRYTYYRPANSKPKLLTASSRPREPDDPPIHESIKEVDFECMGACEEGRHRGWLKCLEESGNTVCGRHPIGVILAALEVLGKAGTFRFVRYERSGEVKTVKESSVSYASAFAVV